MAQPIHNPNMLPSGPVLGATMNGEPPRWEMTPSQKLLLRHTPPTNGAPHHPGSLSSHSSRDPSPGDSSHSLHNIPRAVPAPCPSPNSKFRSGMQLPSNLHFGTVPPVNLQPGVLPESNSLPRMSAPVSSQPGIPSQSYSLQGKSGHPTVSSQQEMPPTPNYHSGTRPYASHSQSGISHPVSSQQEMPPTTNYHSGTRSLSSNTYLGIPPPIYSQSQIPPKNSQLGMLPPNSQPGIPSNLHSRMQLVNSQPGIMSPSGIPPPSNSQPRMPPPSNSQPRMPPPSNSQPRMPSPSNSQSRMPPANFQAGIMSPSNTQSGKMLPSNSQPSTPPPSNSQSRMPLSNSQPGMMTSSNSQPGMPPPQNSLFRMPPSNSQSGIPPPTNSQSRMPPPVSSQPAMPLLPNSQSRMPPPANSQPGVPPTSNSQSRMPPPVNSQPGLPPTSNSQSRMPPPVNFQPGLPPTSNSQSRMPPPVNSQPGLPPTSSLHLGMWPLPSNAHPGMFRPPHPQLGIPPTSTFPPVNSQSSWPQQRPGAAEGVQPQGGADAVNQQLAGLSVNQGFNKMWGMDSMDLLQTRNILPPEAVEAPRVHLHQEFLDSVNCSPEIFRCTITKIPESNSLLQKSRLPLGILIHPFKDLNHLPVIQCSTIVRCRACRTYINPFVYFVDGKRWKCNLCFRVNELPEEFQYDPVSKTYGDPTRRPEVKSSTIEFIAPSEYMLRPPQPAVYLLLLDVSRIAVESGYLSLVCRTLLSEMDSLPGDSRTQLGVLTFSSHVHFYLLGEGRQPQQLVVTDTEDIFLPCPDNLLANLSECREVIRDLLSDLPAKFDNTMDSGCALGPALQAAYKLMAATGGRVTVFQSCLPNVGPGALAAREDPTQRAGKEVPHLNPATDFYKRLALDCSGQQVAVDLFVINGQYCDLATLSGVSRFSGGCMHHFPLFKASNTNQARTLERAFRRYLTRKIGFEAVMRIRCSRGLAIHTFHGNLFVRSTDLLSLPNVNPDAGFGMQVAIEESLSEVQSVCFQAALLYTSSKGERRIRVHTLCLPVAQNLADILHAADQQCIVGLLAKMAVDRSLRSSLSDARDAFINVAVDVLSSFKLTGSGGAPGGGLWAPMSLRLLPLYILALLKHVAFRTGHSTRIDDRLFAMCQMKTMPVIQLIQAIFPDLYPVHCLPEQGTPPRLHLSSEKLDYRGVFLLDAGEKLLLYVGRGAPPTFLAATLGVPAFEHIPENMTELPEMENATSERLRAFVNQLQVEKPYQATLQVVREDGQLRSEFLQYLVEDRSESSLSYHEFLQHVKSNVK